MVEIQVDAIILPNKFKRVKVQSYATKQSTMVSIRSSISRHVPTVADAAASAAFDEEDALGASTEAATEASQKAARISLATTASPSQGPLSAALNPFG